MSDPQRLTRASQQELRSRHQLAARLAEIGWTVADPPDMGEDFICSVYFKGRGTGAAFYVQLKSVSSLESIRTRDFLSYRFRAKDLKHWESFAIPVVLIVWDVGRQEGKWVLANDAIADLDSRRPSWRSQATATVRLPCSNSTGDSGLSSLRSRIGLLLYPLISRGRALCVHLTLAGESEHEPSRAYREVERFYREGGEVTLEGREIKDIRFSDWWQPWSPEMDPDRVYLKILTVPSPHSLLIVVDVVGVAGAEATLSNVEMRTVRAGAEAAILSNAHQACPLLIELHVDRSTREIRAQFTLRQRSHGYNVKETLAVLQFCQAMAEGGKLVITILKTPNSPLELEMPASPQWEPHPVFFRLVQDLCRVQDRMGIRLRIPERGISPDDAQCIDELIQIVNTGKLERKSITAKLTLELCDPVGFAAALHDPALNIGGEWQFADSYVMLFGNKVATGPMTRRVFGTLVSTYGELVNTVSLLSPGEDLELELENCDVVEVYEEWVPIDRPNGNPSSLAS